MAKSVIDIADAAKDFASTASETAKDFAGKAVDTAVKAKESVITALDANGDGQVGIDDIIAKAIHIKGVYINRAAFLQKELYKNHPQEVIDKAIASTPAEAGIPAEEISKIADEVIKFERNMVSGISAALGAPGGLAMVATIPVDITQYYGYTLRATQKLLYLYGFPEIKSDENGLIMDSETINSIIMCLGVMNGVAGANNAIKAMAKALANGVEKKLLNMALTKGTLFPIVKSVMKWFGVNLTKSIFAGAVKDAIPIVGGLVGGGITFATFKPCCNRLKDALKDTMLSNPNHVSSAEEDKLVQDIFEGNFYEVTEEMQDAPSDEENNTEE